MKKMLNKKNERDHTESEEIKEIKEMNDIELEKISKSELLDTFYYSMNKFE